MDVLVSAPFRQDEAVVIRALAARGVSVRPAAAEDVLSADLTEVAAVVLTQDALSRRLLAALGRRLRAQEAWSELPLILLLDSEHHTETTLALLAEALPRSRPVILQRPARPAAFAAAVEASLAARRRQFEVRDLLRWQTELQLEMNHRVKNVLANALAIFHMAKRNSPDLPHLSRSYEERLLALTRAHAALVTAPETQDFGAIARASVEPFVRDGGRVLVEGPSVPLKPTAAVTLALCLQELASNAVEHGALSRPDGSASLRWSAHGDDLRLVWEERPSAGLRADRRRGYGLAFIEAAARRGLKGACDFVSDDQTYRCVLRLPLKALAPLAPVLDPTREYSDA